MAEPGLRRPLDGAGLDHHAGRGAHPVTKTTIIRVAIRFYYYNSLPGVDVGVKCTPWLYMPDQEVGRGRRYVPHKPRPGFRALAASPLIQLQCKQLVEAAAVAR